MPIKLIREEKKPEKDIWIGVKFPVFARCRTGVSKGILFVTGMSNCGNGICGVKIFENNPDYFPAGTRCEAIDSDIYEPIPPGEQIIFENM
jgi:hypothetical protein